MEIVSFVRVLYVRVLPTLDSHICDREDNFLPFSAIIYIYVHDL